MSDVTRAEICAVAIAETFRGDGEVLVVMIDSGIEIRVTDGAATTGLAPFAITVDAQELPVPELPVPAIEGNPPTTVEQDSPYAFTPAVTDTSGASLTFSIENRPT